MSIVSTSNLGVSFGARDVFSGISVQLPNDAKVGLVGPNGVGKTTLLRLLAGVNPPTTGSVHRARGVQIGYLRQEAVDAFAGREHSVHDEMLTVFAHLRTRAAQLREMEDRMAGGEVTDELLAEYGEVQEVFERAGGYDYELRIQRVLEGLGFERDQWGTRLDHLSGGQKTRALLARLLLEQPTLLIMDEPTNHLDVQAVEWLEKTLRDWKGALLVASHDRFFLDRVVDHIWEMSPLHVEVYRGNYSAYVQQRQERWERNQELFEAQMERLWKELEVIERYIAWRKIDEAKGRLQRLSRELVAIEEVGILGVIGKKWSEMGVGRVRMMSVAEARDHIKAIRSPLHRPPMLHVHLKPARRSGQMVLRAKGLQVGYDGAALFAADDLELERLERVALIGPNGSGKTTFLKTVLGEIEPVAGEVQLGANLTIGYFAQAHESLNPESTLIDELRSHRSMSEGEARNYLAKYLFRGDDVWKPIKALSGGERGRLALAVLALDGVNLLLLDEPTNHLDVQAQEVLQEGLEQFEGTLLLVSHDRYLVDQLATQIWELRDGRLHVFRGTYRELLLAREAKTEGPVAASSTNPTAASQGRALAGARGQTRQQGEEREARRRARTLEALEGRIAELEATVERYSRQLQDGSKAGDLDEYRKLAQTYTTAQAELETLMGQWETLATDTVNVVREVV